MGEGSHGLAGAQRTVSQADSLGNSGVDGFPCVLSYRKLCHLSVVECLSILPIEVSTERVKELMHSISCQLASTMTLA